MSKQAILAEVTHNKSERAHSLALAFASEKMKSRSPVKQDNTDVVEFLQQYGRAFKVFYNEWTNYVKVD